ncbi:hypothetical protein [Rariglobus hedericola]|uniref:Uncharacterized protein n=1 Tax=Rariglobus hedericola TaxID=2597822 RepID=A0A556QM66_9BACT|nr:hypothetical protein [Rariglobus hedericola]TSJ77734.1 hypothetical protein FPL22_00035 [Rariglobus hedericola]
MRYLAVFLFSYVSLMADNSKFITGPSIPDVKSPVLFIKALTDKISEEPEKPESLMYINYLATYLILLAEKKDFNPEVFITLNRAAPAIAKLRVSAPIIPSGNEAWKARLIDDPYDAMAHRPFLSFYFYYYFEEAKKSEGKKIPDYTGPIFGTL